MYEKPKFQTEQVAQPGTDRFEFDTSRWTATVYAVQFGQVEIVSPMPDEETGFRMSAWGVSSDLRKFLADYSESEIRESAQWLTMQQNPLVIDVLDQMQNSPFMMPPLEQLFIAVDAELYLPHGLRMVVTCVTNIVPHGKPADELDKFVAVLDPGEAASYVAERRGVGWPRPGERIH